MLRCNTHLPTRCEPVPRSVTGNRHARPGTIGIHADHPIPRTTPAHPNPYRQGLERNAANHVALTPLSLLDRVADVFPERCAVIHGPLRRGAPLHQHPTGLGHGGDFARALRQPRTDRRLRVRARRERRRRAAARGRQAGALCYRRRRPGARRRRRVLRRDRVRGLRRRWRPGVRTARARRGPTPSGARRRSPSSSRARSSGRPTTLRRRRSPPNCSRIAGSTSRVSSTRARSASSNFRRPPPERSRSTCCARSRGRLRQSATAIGRPAAPAAAITPGRSPSAVRHVSVRPRRAAGPGGWS